VQNLCDALADEGGVDPSAVIDLHASAGGMRVEVTLAEGRRAEREVGTPDELVPTVEALVLLPEVTRAAPAQAAAPPSPPSAAAPPSPPPAAETPPPPSAAVAEPAPAATSLELGVAITGHWSGAPGYVSSGMFVYAGARVNGWLIGLGLRWDAFDVALHPTLSGLEGESAGASLLLARTLFERQAWAFELGAAGQLLVATQELEAANERELGRSAAEFLLGLHGRLLLLPGAVRPTILLDAALAPARLRHGLTLYQKLPVWSIGVALGVAWRPS
jgi:hypothetical protein